MAIADVIGSLLAPKPSNDGLVDCGEPQVVPDCRLFASRPAGKDAHALGAETDGGVAEGGHGAGSSRLAIASTARHTASEKASPAARFSNSRTGA